MISDEIQTSFSGLINLFDEILPVINKHVSQLLKEQRYQEAGELITKAEKIVIIQGQIGDLKEDWSRLDVSAIESALLSVGDLQRDMEPLVNQFKAEPHSSYKVFRMPVLQALINLGGEAQRKQVLIELETLMAYQLTENDWHTLPSDGKSIRWHKIATHARTSLLNEGYITVDVKKGSWAITPEGKKALERSV